MQIEHYFYNCSKEYIEAIDSHLYKEFVDLIAKLPKRQYQTEINHDLWWLLTTKGWSYDSIPKKMSDLPLPGLEIENPNKCEITKDNNRSICITSTTLGAKWYADFAKSFPRGLVQIEAQFGTVESMFKDFCGFRIAYLERRLALGIEIVMCEPNKYFGHRKESVAGMAYFDIAKRTLPSIGLDCPIWLIGIKE